MISEETVGQSPVTLTTVSILYLFEQTKNLLTILTGWPAKTLDEGKAAVKSIQEFHQDGRGWSDIGYHFFGGYGG